MKGVIIEVDLYSQIRTLYTEGESKRSIASRLGISRQTVNKYCEGNTHPDVRKTYIRAPDIVTDDVKAFIIGCMNQDRVEKLHKQKHTAKRIFDRLAFEKGFTGSYSAIRDIVRTIKAEYSVPLKADVPLEYDLGDAMQIDWGEATAYIDNQKMKINFFCGR